MTISLVFIQYLRNAVIAFFDFFIKSLYLENQNIPRRYKISKSMNNKLDNGGGGAEILDEFARILFQVQLLPRRIIRSKTNWNELQQPEESPKGRRFWFPTNFDKQGLITIFTCWQLFSADKVRFKILLVGSTAKLTLSPSIDLLVGIFDSGRNDLDYSIRQKVDLPNRAHPNKQST